MSAAILLALASAGAWGAADFVGGVAGRRAAPVSVAFASQLVGLVAIIVVAPLVPATFRSGDVAWGIGAGAGAAAGVALLYHGLAVGLMSVVAPVTAVGAASIPVLFGLVAGERPAPAALIGVGVALAAVALLSAFPGTPEGSSAEVNGRPDRNGLGLGLAAGAGFGAFFVFLDHAGHDAGLWPLLGSRTASVVILAAVALATRHRLVPGAVGREVVVVGLFDVGANVAYLLASRRGLLSIVALVASLYPASTVVLARVLLRERLSPAQALGLAGVGGAIALIALA